MKTKIFLLIASLAGNACLLGLLIAGANTDSTSSAPAAAPRAVPARMEPANANAWSELQDADLSAHAARLRAEDFPPRIVRAILASQIRERFAARRKALAAEDPNAPFWLPPGTGDPQKQAELRAIAREERRLLAELLGPDLENGTAASLRRLMPNVAEEKIAQLAEIRERYDEKRTELYANVRGSILPDEIAQSEAIEKGIRAEFASVLTPQEFENYELRASRTAQQLRYNLAAFDVTEAEFRALFRLQSGFDEQFGTYRGPSSPDQTRARAVAQRQLTEEIKAALGEGRYAEYQRATDYNYRQTTQLVARLNLPPETVKDLYALQEEFQQKVAAVGRTPATPGERMAQRTALAAEAQARVTAKLGASGCEAYKQYGGAWLQRLIPPPGTQK